MEDIEATEISVEQASVEQVPLVEPTPRKKRKSIIGAVTDKFLAERPAPAIDPVQLARAEEVAAKLSGTEQVKALFGNELLVQLIEQASSQGVDSVIEYLSALADRVAVITITLDKDGDLVSDDMKKFATDEEKTTWTEKSFRLIALKDLTGERLGRMIKFKQMVSTMSRAYRKQQISIVELAEDLYVNDSSCEFLADAYSPVGEKYNHDVMMQFAPKLKEAITLEMIVGVLYRFFTASGFSKAQTVIRTYLDRLVEPLLVKLRSTSEQPMSKSSGTNSSDAPLSSNANVKGDA